MYVLYDHVVPFDGQTYLVYVERRQLLVDVTLASSTARALLSWHALHSLHLVVIAKKHVDWRTRAPVKKFFHGVQVLHTCHNMRAARNNDKKISEPPAQTSRGCATKYTVYPGIKKYV